MKQKQRFFLKSNYMKGLLKCKCPSNKIKEINRDTKMSWLFEEQNFQDLETTKKYAKYCGIKEIGIRTKKGSIKTIPIL
jgi:hypothetical protein